MTDLMLTLYEYTRDKEMGKYLLDEEYRSVRQAIRWQQESILQQTPALFDPLDDLLSEINLERAFELEAMFQAAFWLGTRLSKI